MTLALSIRQPWASLILLAGKDIENRTWHTNVRGQILIHASTGMTRREYINAMEFAKNRAEARLISGDLFTFENLPRGGIIGSVNLVDCISGRACGSLGHSQWFEGPFGFKLCNPRSFLAEDFVPFKGQLGFFDVPGVEP